MSVCNAKQGNICSHECFRVSACPYAPKARKSVSPANAFGVSVCRTKAVKYMSPPNAIVVSANQISSGDLKSYAGFVGSVGSVGIWVCHHANSPGVNFPIKQPVRRGSIIRLSRTGRVRMPSGRVRQRRGIGHGLNNQAK